MDICLLILTLPLSAFSQSIIKVYFAYCLKRHVFCDFVFFIFFQFVCERILITAVFHFCVYCWGAVRTVQAWLLLFYCHLDLSASNVLCKLINRTITMMMTEIFDMAVHSKLSNVKIVSQDRRSRSRVKIYSCWMLRM